MGATNIWLLSLGEASAPLVTSQRLNFTRQPILLQKKKKKKEQKKKRSPTRTSQQRVIIASGGPVRNVQLLRWGLCEGCTGVSRAGW